MSTSTGSNLPQNPSSKAGNTSHISQLIKEHIGLAENLGVAVLDANRHHLYANDVYLAMIRGDAIGFELGMTLDQVIEHIFSGEQFNSDYHTLIKEDISKMDKLLKSGETFKTSRILKTSHENIIEMNGVYTADHHLVMTVRDITDAAMNKEMLDISLDEGRAGFWSYDFNKNKFTYSDSVKNRLNAAEIERINTTGLWGIILQEDLPDMMRDWNAAITEGKPLNLTYRVKTEKDGIMWQRSKGRIHKSNDGSNSHAIAYVTDITKDVKMHQDLVDARKISHDKSQFLARMSHEIKTPLNAIIALSDNLKHSKKLTKDDLESVQFIEEAAENLHHLLSQTLDHTKLTTENIVIQKSRYSPRKIIENLYGLWLPKCKEKNLALKLTIDNDIVETCHLDKMRVQQCLNNLISNAIKFTEKGGIHIVAKSSHTPKGQLVVFAVKDTGTGIDAGNLDKIFEAYHQEDNSISRRYDGTGLGLNITKGLAELMGGTISVRSTMGKGSVFALAFPVNQMQTETNKSNASSEKRLPSQNMRDQETATPLQPRDISDQMSPQSDTDILTPTIEIDNTQTQASSENSAESTATIAQNATQKDQQLEDTLLPPAISTAISLAGNPEVDRPFAGLKVLCVEDNKINQGVVKRLIGTDVKTLAFADNGLEALKHLNNQHFDLVLMDIHMPEMNGIEATIEIRNSEAPWANVIIIAITADVEYQQERICRNLGMNDAIAKPVKRQDILDAFTRTFMLLKEKHSHAVRLAG